MTDFCRPVPQSFWKEELFGPKANFELKLQIYHNGKAEGNVEIISLPCLYNYNQKKWNYRDIGILELKEELYKRGVFGNVPFNLIVLYFCGKALMEYDVNSRYNDTTLSKIGFLDNLSQTYPLEYKIFSSDADVRRVFDFNCGYRVPDANGHIPPRHKPYSYLKSMGEECLNGTIIYARETNTSYCKKILNKRQVAPLPAPLQAPSQAPVAPVAPVAPIIRYSNKAKQELNNINNLMARIRNQQAKLNRFIQVQPAGQVAGKRKTKRSKRKNRKTKRNLYS